VQSASRCALVLAVLLPAAAHAGIIDAFPDGLIGLRIDKDTSADYHMAMTDHPGQILGGRRDIGLLALAPLTGGDSIDVFVFASPTWLGIVPDVPQANPQAVVDLYYGNQTFTGSALDANWTGMQQVVLDFAAALVDPVAIDLEVWSNDSDYAFLPAYVTAPAGSVSARIGLGDLVGPYDETDVDGLAIGFQFDAPAAASFNVTGITVQVPEPTALLLLGAGAGTVLQRKRRSSKNRRRPKAAATA